MNIPMLDLVEQYKTIKPEIDAAISKVLNSGTYINGSQVKEFESHMEQFLNVKHAIGVASGSDALVLSLHALGIGPGDKVIVPTFTFFATAGAVTRMGATPIFADIDPETYNIDLNQVEDLLKRDNNIKAMIPVHLFGLPVNMQKLLTLVNNYNLKVIEDACQAINAEIYWNTENASNVHKAGTLGHAGCFSFFPSKNLGCFGDGGMIITNDDQLAEKFRILRAHGSNPKYYHKIVGYNSRLDTIQAAILNVKLKYLNDWTQKRRAVAQKYNETFETAGLTPIVKVPKVAEGHVFHQYVIEVDNRDQLASYLKQKGISTAIYYPLPLHLQECFSTLGYQKGDLPAAEQAAKKVLALPIDTELKTDEITYIVNTITDYIK